MVLDRVTKIIAEVLQIGYADVMADRELTAYGIDSARSMDLVIALEDAFNVEISDAIMLQFRTVNDIVRSLENL